VRPALDQQDSAVVAVDVALNLAADKARGSADDLVLRAQVKAVPGEGSGSSPSIPAAARGVPELSSVLRRARRSRTWIRPRPPVRLRRSRRGRVGIGPDAGVCERCSVVEQAL
jgi:hypothetical protein